MAEPGRLSRASQPSGNVRLHAVSLGWWYLMGISWGWFLAPSFLGTPLRTLTQSATGPEVDQFHKQTKASAPLRRQMAVSWPQRRGRQPRLCVPVLGITTHENGQATAQSGWTESSGKVQLPENAS